jgi:hypothetical protein
MTRENADAALQPASLPDRIRGYGRVKEKAMAIAAKRKLLLAEYRHRSKAVAA